MKRKPKEKCMYEMGRSFPLRWQLCESCKQEFRFEKGWIYFIPQYGYKYVCGSCGKTKDSAITLINRNLHIPPRPPIGQSGESK